MSRIDTTRTDRLTFAVPRAPRKDRVAEAAILAAGIVFGGLLVMAQDAFGADPQGLPSASAPGAGMSVTSPARLAELEPSLPAASIDPDTPSGLRADPSGGPRVAALEGSASRAARPFIPVRRPASR